jgi:hypothetical protein
MEKTDRLVWVDSSRSPMSEIGHEPSFAGGAQFPL